MGGALSTHGRKLQAKFWPEKLKVSFNRLKDTGVGLILGRVLKK
jgi:hypothetical protein